MSVDVLFIDHYDSFSFNLIDWISGKGCPFRLHRLAYDEIVLADWVAHPLPIVLSPGPKAPQDAVETLNLVKALWGRVPMFGICLGHQILGHFLGAGTEMSCEPFHGSVRDIFIRRWIPQFPALPGRIHAASYNSLVVNRKKLREDWIFAENTWGEVEGIFLHAASMPVLGLQFHPESFMSQGQEPFLNWWWQAVAQYYSNTASSNIITPQQQRPYLSPRNSEL
ncbi:MAG: aminodeoxychorismate/anthranilate synthase component II [Oligoflexus sp.]